MAMSEGNGRGRRICGVLAAAAGALLAATAGAMAEEPVILRLNFTPWAMHAQYYAAQQQGFYKAEGLDVEIRPAAGGQQNEVFIATGKEQFGISNADSFIKARASGVPVVAIMADQPDTPFSIITLKTSHITTPAQLKGRKIAWLVSNVKGMLDPMLATAGLTRNDVEFVTVGRGAEVQMVAAGATDALFGYYYGQALTLDMKGMPTDVMPLRDYGVKFYGSIMYTSEQLLKQKPETALKFVRATLKGLIWTKDHMSEAMNYVVAVAPDRDHDLETHKLALIYDIFKSPDYAEAFGMMNDAKWQSSIDILADGGDLPKKPTVSQMYTNKIVQDEPEARRFAAMLKAR
jgi:NitT/TauT family transport system substrate-binding protein